MQRLLGASYRGNSIDGRSGRPHCRCWTSGADLDERWSSRLVATPWRNRLSSRHNAHSLAAASDCGTIAIYGVRGLSGDAEVARVLRYTPSHIFRPGFVDHIGERAVRADYPPHTGIGFIWNNMREGFDVGHRAILQPFAIRQEPEDGNT